MNIPTSTTKLFATGLLLATVAGCTRTVVHDQTVVVPDPRPIEAPAEEPVDTLVVEGDVEEVVEETIEEPLDYDDSVIHIEVDRQDASRGPRLRGAAVAHFNTGYLDGWAGADFFNRGRPLDDVQVDRMIEVGRRQGDPTGKLALDGYAEGYRAGAKRQRNPYYRRMTADQAARFRTMRGLPADPAVVDVGPGRPPRHTPGTPNETYVNVEAPAQARAPVIVRGPHRRHRGLTEAARQQRLEASRNNLAASQNNLEAEQKRLEPEQKKLEVARLEKETARRAELEAAKQNREAGRQQREMAFKAKLEAGKKEREAERQRLEVARQEREAARDAEIEAAREKRAEKRDERQAAREKREAEREQKLAAKKAEREAKKTETATTAEKP